MPEKFNELLLKPDIIELYNAGITPNYGYLMNGRFEKDMVKTLYPLKTLSGNPITWEASDTEYLFPVVSLEPKQAGTGDPSPENVRPITGRNEVAVTRCKKNLADYTKAQPRSSSQTVEIIPNGVKWSGDYFFVIPITGLPNGTTIVCTYTSELAGLWNIQYSDRTYDEHYSRNGAPLTLNSNKTPENLLIYSLKPDQVVTDAIFTNIQLEFGSTPTAYEPYQGETYTLTLPNTIYGGTVDAVTGVGSKTWGYIASYNGESLPGEWISDRDVYLAGTTPTTGAQVAYKLANPEPFQATGNQALTIQPGNHTIYTNGTDISLTRKARRLEV